MANRYLIVIPPHKEPHIKSFNNQDGALSIIAAKTEHAQTQKIPCDFFERETVIISADGKKKKTLPVNQKASFLASAECGEKIHGNAVITDAPGNEICGFTLEDAEGMLKEINNIYIGA